MKCRNWIHSSCAESFRQSLNVTLDMVGVSARQCFTISSPAWLFIPVKCQAVRISPEFLRHLLSVRWISTWVATPVRSDHCWWSLSRTSMKNAFWHKTKSMKNRIIKTPSTVSVMILNESLLSRFHYVFHSVHDDAPPSPTSTFSIHSL